MCVCGYSFYEQPNVTKECQKDNKKIYSNLKSDKIFYVFLTLIFWQAARKCEIVYLASLPCHLSTAFFKIIMSSCHSCINVEAHGESTRPQKKTVWSGLVKSSGIMKAQHQEIWKKNFSKLLKTLSFTKS